MKSDQKREEQKREREQHRFIRRFSAGNWRWTDDEEDTDLRLSLPVRSLYREETRVRVRDY